ncbi:ATP-binding cassette domain-containing protein [Hymenobacter cellulosivorans]|uniref:UvrABC system protein A n=1 Tax=Hymenobacter cellulosivorans TaxID=2932249 RepID=A0ABY4F4M5_9BACT|nr:excinuclease ABC subunit UvrA [Hymenobacter cellulosivorans]UOQ51609.1 excinuclease ABC subunit UvrA [Hymenobacter cellulosivorans]
MASSPLALSPDFVSTFGCIEVRGACENNLQHVSLDIPKRRITVFTGVSGSGKSSLVFSTLAAESQRLLNETYPAFVQGFLPRYGQPHAESLTNLSATIVVDQQRLGGNSRSTVGTVTDTYALLRLVYARLGTPAAGGVSAFSFNEVQGMCPACGGLGQVTTVRPEQLTDPSKSLNEGALLFPTFSVHSPFWTIVAQSGFFDPDKKLRDYTEQEWHQLLYLPEIKVQLAGALGTGKTTYEGLVPKFRRVYLSKDANQLQAHLRPAFERMVTQGACGTCHGARLNQAALNCRIGGVNIAECANLPVSELAAFVRQLTAPALAPLLTALATRLEQLVAIGLGYLTLGRESATLSGGESQRVKMVRHLGSSLTDLTYVFDEPSIGLHPHDVPRLNALLRQLRDKGNTVLVVEHRPAVIAIADHVVDMGPQAGRGGGRIVYQGSYAGLLAADTRTSQGLRHHQPLKAVPRPPTGQLQLRNASLHNLRDVSLNLPTGVLTVVTGVAGAGKTSLLLGCLPQQHPEAIVIDQRISRGSKRSNPATYLGLLDPIRKAFAVANGVSAALFSANSKGACPNCQGLGVVYTDLAHLDPVATVCETCEGRRFTAEVLGYRLRGKTISDVLNLSMDEAGTFFTEPAVGKTLQALVDVGLQYLTLGQPLNTLSGGERQRLELAGELGKTAQVYILDEPTTGLHLHDVATLLQLLNRLVDNGSTVLVVENHLDVISSADWVVELGPGAGSAGGRVLFEGTPAALLTAADSVTARYLAQYHRTGSTAAAAPLSHPAGPND